MKTISQKLISLSLVGLILVMSTMPAYAREQTSDPYAQNMIEKIVEGDTTYTYKYAYDENHNGEITVTNDKDDDVYVITTKEQEDGAKIYVNNYMVAEIVRNSDNTVESNGTDWIFIGSDSLLWTQEYATTTTAVAEGLAQLINLSLDFAGVSWPVKLLSGAILGACGKALEIYVNKYVNATVYTTMYQQTSWGQTTIRADFSILFEGRWSDVYSIYMPLNAYADEHNNKIRQ